MDFITIVPVLRHEVIGLLFFFSWHTSAFWRQLIHERPQYFDTHFKWLSGAVLMFLVNSGMSLLGITPGSCRQSKWLVGYHRPSLPCRIHEGLTWTSPLCLDCALSHWLVPIRILCGISHLTWISTIYITFSSHGYYHLVCQGASSDFQSRTITIIYTMCSMGNISLTLVKR